MDDLKKIKLRDKRNTSWGWYDKELLRDKNLSASDKIIYLSLTSFSNENTQECWPSISTLGLMSGVSIRQVIISLQKLEKIGYILIKKTAGKSSVYTLIDHTSAENAPVQNTHKGGAVSARVLVQNTHTNNNNRTRINNKNKKEIYKEKSFSSLKDITKQDIQEIADDYCLTYSKVAYVFEQLSLYDKKPYKNYKLALRKWVVRDIGVDGLAKARSIKNNKLDLNELSDPNLTDEQRFKNLEKLKELKIKHGLISDDSTITTSNT